MACVYIHRKLTNNEVFYVGVAARKDRPYSKNNRNNHWKNIVNKYGFVVEIVKCDLTYCCALTLEKILISFYGRKDLGLGNLVNMTDGGEGTINMSIESKLKISESKKGLIVSEQTRNKIRLSLIGRVSNRVDFKHSKKTKKRISEIRSKQVMLLETGEIFSSILQASLKTGVGKSAVGRSCRNKKPTGNLNFRFYEGVR